jgi:putative nucleotidyltransferase with HDIG domain
VPAEKIDLERVKASVRDLHPMSDTSVRLLKLANSAFYGVRGGVSSVTRAVSFIGFSAVQELVLCIQAHGMLEGTGRGTPRWLAAHNQSVAALSRWLAVKHAPAVRDQALTAGLMHDLGRMALFALFPAQVAAYLEGLSRGIEGGIEAERTLIGVDHEQVGAVVATAWRFPAALVQVISNHTGEVPPASGGTYDAVQRLCDIVAVADAWAWQLGNPGVPGGKAIEPHPTRVARAGLTASPLPEDRAVLLKALNDIPPL